MSKLSSHILVGVLMLAALGAAAKTVSEAVDGSLIVKFFAANNDLYRVETSTRTGDTAFETLITDANGTMLGKVERVAISVMQNTDGTTTYVTRNTRTDAHGNYLRTDYSIIIADEDGKLAQITDLEGLRDASDLSVRSLLDDRDFTPLTVGGDLNDN